MDTMENNLAVIDPDTFSVRRTIRISAPVDRVWEAVTAPEHISRWFGRAALAGSGVGALGTLTWDDRGSIPFRIEALEAPRLITYRWSNDDALGAIPDSLDEEHSTVFTFTLDPIDGGTLLTVVETGFENTSDAAANLEAHRQGWNSELDELVALF
jgi:uncharacterized protein YndB with AHSA1/START domain